MERLDGLLWLVRSHTADLPLADLPMCECSRAVVVWRQGRMKMRHVVLKFTLQCLPFVMAIFSNLVHGFTFGSDWVTQ